MLRLTGLVPRSALPPSALDGWLCPFRGPPSFPSFPLPLFWVVAPRVPRVFPWGCLGVGSPLSVPRRRLPPISWALGVLSVVIVTSVLRRLALPCFAVVRQELEVALRAQSKSLRWVSSLNADGN